MKKNILFMFFIVLSVQIFAQVQIDDQTKQRILAQHNLYRAEQGAPDLVWSDELANYAQIWANTIAKKDQLIHSEYDYGENIYVASYEPTPEEVVDLWCDEQRFYNGEEISYQNFSLFGHYTQVIWEFTVSIGCATAVSKSGNHYWVCEYNPAGNTVGKKPVAKYKKPANNK